MSDRKNIDPEFLTYQRDKFYGEQITDHTGRTEENWENKDANDFAVKFNRITNSLKLPGTSDAPYLAPTKHYIRRLTDWFAGRRQNLELRGFNPQKYLDDILQAHGMPVEPIEQKHDQDEVNDVQEPIDEENELGNPAEEQSEEEDDTKITDQHREFAHQHGLDPDSLVVSHGDVYALTFPWDTKKCGVYRLSRQKGRRLRRNVIEMYALASAGPILGRWFEYAEKNLATPNRFHHQMMSLIRIYLSMKQPPLSKNEAWRFILKHRYWTHRRRKFAGIDGLRDGFPLGGSYQDWVSYQTEPFADKVNVEQLIQSQQRIQDDDIKDKDLQNDRRDVLNRIFVPLNEMFGRIRRIGRRNTQQWLEESKGRRTHQTWVKVGNNQKQNSKAFEDVPEEFQEELRDSQKQCRTTNRNKRKFDEFKQSLEHLKDRDVRFAQIREWLVDERDPNEPPPDDVDAKVVLKYRPKFKRFRRQDNEKLKRRMRRLGLPEFHARRVENNQDDEQKEQDDPFRIGRRKRRKRQQQNVNQPQHVVDQQSKPVTKLEPLKSFKFKGTTDKWLQIDVLRLAKKL